MSGMFDDLIPQQQGGGMFDDLIPSQSKEPESDFLGDLGVSAKQGAVELATLPGKAVRFATGFMGFTPQWVEDLDSWAEKKNRELQAQKSPAGQKADQDIQQAITEEAPVEAPVLAPGTAGIMGIETGDTEEVRQYALDPDKVSAAGVAQAGAQSAPSMAAQYALGRGVTGALNRGAAGLTAEAAAAARVKNAVAGQASTNAGLVAAETYAETYEAAIAAGMDETEARARAYAASGIAAPVAAVTGGALGRATAPAAGRGFGAAAGRLAGAVAVGSAEEAAEELVQGGAKNVAMGEDFINAESMNRGLIGGLVGGPFAAGAAGVETAIGGARAPAPAVDASTVLDPETQPTPQAPSKPLALPAPRVVVNERGEAIREGSGQVFDEPPAKVAGRAEPELRQAVREELVALGFEPTRRATPTPVVVDSAGQARTDEQTPTRDPSMEPAARSVGRAPVEVRERVAEEIKALGFEPTPRASTPITVDPAGNAAVAGDTRDPFTAAEQMLDARARKLYPKDTQAREDWKVFERAREMGYEARVRDLAERSNERKKKRGVPIQTTPRPPAPRDIEPTSELGVVSRKLPDGGVEYSFAIQPEVRLVVKPDAKYGEARVIVEAPQEGQQQLVRAALADGPIAAGPKTLARGVAQQIGAATDRFGVTRLVGRDADRARIQAETSRMAARSAVTLATKKWAADAPEMDVARKAIAADPKAAVTALRQKDPEAALTALRQIAPEAQAPVAEQQADQDVFTEMPEIERDPRAVYRESGIPDDPEFVSYVTDAARDAVRAGHLERDEFFAATRAARENRRDEAMEILRRSDQRRGAVNSSGSAKAADPEVAVNLEPATGFEGKFGEPREMGATGRRLNEVYSLSEEQAAAVSAALRDLVEMGLPRAWINSVQRFFAVSEQLRNSAATFWMKSLQGQPVRIISFTEGMNSTIPGRRASLEEQQQFRGRLAHELAHNADWNGSELSSAGHPDLQFSVESGKIVPVGKVAKELFDVWLDRQSALSRLLAYPFIQLSAGALDPKVGVPELHAQIIRAYFTNRGELDYLAPEAYQYAEQFIRGAADAASGRGVQGEVRQRAVGGLRPDGRGDLGVADEASGGDRQGAEPPAVSDGLRDQRGRRDETQGVDDGLRPERAGDRAGRDQGRSDPPRADAQDGRLRPLPGYAHGNIQGAAGPDPRLVAVAEQYARDNGIQLRRQARYAQVDPERAARIAAAYDAMPHAPQDPAVREAYENLIRQTTAQYRALEAAGYRFWFMDPEADPYDGNPWNAMRDLRANQSMAVFPTEAGFGSNEEFDPANNPLLADTGITWPWGSMDGEPKRVLANDLFRAVHDALGHGIEGAGFRAQGEENAWQAHARLFTGSALGALTSETRGQNSWLNFGPHGESNRNAKVEDTVFADQKTGLMPEWTWTEGLVEDKALAQRGAPTETPEFKRWFGDSKVVDAGGRPLVVYHGTTGDFGEFTDTVNRKGDPRTGEARGFFFARDPDLASRYAERDGGSVYPVYVSIKTPMPREVESPGPGYKKDALFPGGFSPNEQDIRTALAAGYDGIIRGDEIIAFRPEQIKSAIGNNGAFDPESPSILDVDRELSPVAKQKAVSLEQYLYTDKLVMTPKFRTQAELGAWLDEKAQAALGRSLVGDYSPEALKHVAGVFAREGELAMEKAGNAGQWYRASINGALENSAKLYPEIANDPNHKFIFTLALAVTSNGTDMGTNTRLGFTAYEQWRVFGKLPMALKGAGERGKNMIDAFDAVNRMVEKAGKVDVVREFMLTKRSVREIRDGLASIGVKVSQAENADAVVYGGYALGPKIGAAFLPNLNGKWDALTADRWFSRTFNRIVGGMLDNSGKTVDAPRSGAERQFMRDALNAALKRMRRNGYDLEMADLQALLWYPEKELYAVMGVSDKRAAPTDYEQETRKYVEARLQSEEPAAAAAGPQQGGRPGNAQGGAPKAQGKQVALFDAAGDPDKSFGLDTSSRGWVTEELSRVEGSRTARTGAAATKAATPVTATAQAINKGVDRIGEEIARVTGLKKVGEKAVAAVDKAIAAKSSWTWVERLKQGLIADYGLPEEYLSAKVAKQSRENKLLRDAKGTLDRLSAMTPDQLAVAYQWLQEKPDTAREQELISRLPADQREIVQKMKDDIDRLSREAVKLGLITEETYERNRMAYVHRSYKKYEAELTGGQIASRQRAVRLKGDQFKGRGMELEADLDRVHGDLPQELKGLKLEMLELRDDSGRLRRREFVVSGSKRPARLTDYKSAGTWEIRDATKTGHVKIWRDFTLAERQRMGEIEDARYGFARTMLQGVRDVETARFLGWTARKYAKKDKDGLDVVDIKPLAQLLGSQTFTQDEWVKVPEVHIAGTSVPRYGKLAGLYVPGIIWNDLAGVMELHDGVWDKMLSAWKISKTALSPAVHVNNVMANFVMADLADVGVNDIRKALETILAAKGGDPKARALIERYEDSGAESGSFAANEIRTGTLEPLLAQIAKSEPEAVQKASLAHVVSLAAHGRFGEAAAATARTLPGRAIGGTVESMIRAYQAEDSVFRLAKFLNETAAGKTDLQAGRAAREAFLNYDINAPWVRAARRTVLPFISFTYRAVPLIARAAATKPWKFAKYLALGQAMGMLAYGMLGEAGDEEEERRLLPDEMKGSTIIGLPKMIRMPWNDDDGDPMWLDVRRWIPAADIADVNQSKAAVPLPQWLSIGGPMSLLIDFYSNTNWRGDKVVQETDSAGETIEKASDMVLKFALPNLPVPGLGWTLRQVGAPVDAGMLDPYSWTNIERAITGAKSPTGKEKGVGQAAANAVGVKLQSRRIAEELNNIGYDHKAAEREIKTEATRIARQHARGQITAAERDRRIRAEVEKLQELGRETGKKLTPQR